MSKLKTISLVFFNFSMVFLKEPFSRPLLFILYTNPLSTVISNSSANHHLYADDTQLFFSFSAADFAYSISHLEYTIPNVCNWMSSNFLSLNSSCLLVCLCIYYIGKNKYIIPITYSLYYQCNYCGDDIAISSPVGSRYLDRKIPPAITALNYLQSSQNTNMAALI